MDDDRMLHVGITGHTPNPDDVREKLVRNMAKIIATNFDIAHLWGDYLYDCGIVVDALGLVTDRKLRVLTEECWDIRFFRATPTQRRDRWYVQSPPGTRPLETYSFHDTLEAAVAAAWEARGS
jgi:hypothetical protein